MDKTSKDVARLLLPVAIDVVRCLSRWRLMRHAAC